MKAKWAWSAAWLLLTVMGAVRAQQMRTHYGTAEYYRNRGSRQRMVNLNAYRNHRLLLIFAPNASDTRIVQQKAKIKSAVNAFKARDMLLFEVTETGPSRAGQMMLTADQADYLRQHFEIKRGKFAVLLVGKDGGVKRRSRSVVQMGELFGQVDTMPMRRNEMRQRDRTGN